MTFDGAPKKIDLFPSIKHEKTTRLVDEFGLKAPSLETYLVVERLLQSGSFPLMKSITLDAAESLFDRGELKQGERMRFKGIYASLVLAKSYGEISLELMPQLLQRRNFTAYAVDHATRYVRNQLHSGKTLEEIMLKYTLTPDEFFEFYSFCVASFIDHPAFEYDPQQYEGITQFLRFDITLPALTRADVQRVYIRHSEIDKGSEEEQIDRIRLKMGEIETIEIDAPLQSFREYAHLQISLTAAAILDCLMKQYDLSEEIILACLEVA